ncbi:MAG: NAD-dependent epimerase/dehydratase family protein [Candidatus Methanoperedens sp.]
MINKVLITGGAGFIGSHLAEALIRKGYDIIIVDDMSRGRSENLKNIINKIEFIRGNILNFELMEELVKRSDIIFHLAALSRVMPSIENPELCFKSNIEGTEIMARICARSGRKLIFSSSREVYGTAKYIPVDEHHPLNPENPYGTSKIAGEKIIESYSKCYDLKYSILRLANIYGDRDFDRVIPIFIKNCLNNNDLIVYGGEQIIDFIYISDVIEAFLKILETNENIILNVGSGKGTTLIDLAQNIFRISEKKGKIITKEKRKAEVECFIADIGKAQKILNWNPEVSLENGLEKLFFKSRLSI